MADTYFNDLFQTTQYAIATDFAPLHSWHMLGLLMVGHENEIEICNACRISLRSLQKGNRRDVLVNAESFGAKLVDAFESLIALFWFADASGEWGFTGQRGATGRAHAENPGKE